MAGIKVHKENFKNGHHELFGITGILQIVHGKTELKHTFILVQKSTLKSMQSFIIVFIFINFVKHAHITSLKIIIRLVKLGFGGIFVSSYSTYSTKDSISLHILKYRTYLPLVC